MLRDKSDPLLPGSIIIPDVARRAPPPTGHKGQGQALIWNCDYSVGLGGREGGHRARAAVHTCSWNMDLIGSPTLSQSYEWCLTTADTFLGCSVAFLVPSASSSNSTVALETNMHHVLAFQTIFSRRMVCLLLQSLLTMG